MITPKLNPEIWIITDTHLIADSLHDDGAAFIRMQNTSQGKDLFYQETALRAFCKMANEKKPAAIIVTGDVTFNGELISAVKFNEIFSDLTETKLLVLPGNHDIYDGWARKFIGNKQYLTKQISPQKWHDLFQTSYNCSLNQDPSSLAYSVQLNPQYLLLLLDSNIYHNHESFHTPATEGQISAAQVKWLKKQLVYAQQHHLRPLLFMHHNLYAHNSAVNRGFVLNNAPILRQLCQEYDIKLAFSGHIHAQNIIGPVDTIPTIEIVTSSFCSYDQAYGVVQLSAASVSYKRQVFDMRPYISTDEQNNQILMHFHEYLKQIQLRNLTGNSQHKDQATSKQSLTKKINQLFLDMNYNYFTGHNHIEKQKLLQLYNSPEYQTLVAEHPKFSKYLATLYDTSDHSNLTTSVNY
ncbi:metallophosphoesterase [Lactobacillus sp. ESL0785]|uniref:metallophosphoesterase n=1 Tax=Lactobacillus sp. ESL0785 TaxID=2983232 RepID=UPI0023F7C4E0|nr:metallophosphoesterase [Lactobacillus sp. ESL0785]WEV70168.1 metallophosphoesterase [Lactobacillus sp. ESL0785]